ncbi:MAG: hypothetical protein NC400_10935 [Clostridium sp.]|nr:hypothetical protein [Clostridium sp.]
MSLYKDKRFSLIYCVAAGIIASTVYTEIFSIFAKIGACAHLLLLAAALLLGYMGRERLRQLWRTCRPVLWSWEGFFYVCFIILIAFFTSRGEFHTDTNIYHAAAIRIYEEYGLVKGIGNLQLHYAYNSSYLAFASIFSLRWALGRSLHTTTGFLEVVMCLYAFHGLKDFRRHKNHVTDMMRVGILFYTLVNMTRSMSPATDYAAMFFALFIITAWCENLFEGGSDVTLYSLLSVAAVFTATLKFSACLLALIVIYPAVCLVKDKKWKEIADYLLSGCIILCPFLVRNYLISGWLLYPFNAIDLFHPEWKIPEEYLLHDANQIKVWGRCLYDVAKVDMPVHEWLPIWWGNQFRYEQMFLGAVVLSAVLQLVIVTARLVKKRKIRLPFAVLHLAIWGNIAVWFLMAPFIRYGLAFLFAVIMIAAGGYLGGENKGLYGIVTGSLLFCIVVSVSPYWDQYITDAGVFVKQTLRNPYYIVQKDYEKGSMDSCEINGNTVYFSTGEEINSYHVFPGTCYDFMLERSTLIGDRIEDGFKAK